MEVRGDPNVGPPSHALSHFCRYVRVCDPPTHNILDYLGTQSWRLYLDFVRIGARHNQSHLVTADNLMVFLKSWLLFQPAADSWISY